MQDDIDVKVFKNELMNYNYYQYQCNKLKEDIDYNYGLLPGNVRGLNPSKLPIHGGVPNLDNIYAIRDTITLLEAKLRRYNDKMVEVEQILEKIETPLKSAIMDKYIIGYTLEKVSKDYGYSSAGLLKKMNKAIKKALED